MSGNAVGLVDDRDPGSRGGVRATLARRRGQGSPRRQRRGHRRWASCLSVVGASARRGLPTPNQRMAESLTFTWASDGGSLAILAAVNSFKEEPMRTKTFLSIVGAAAALGTGAVAATGADGAVVVHASFGRRRRRAGSCATSRVRSSRSIAPHARSRSVTASIATPCRPSRSRPARGLTTSPGSARCTRGQIVEVKAVRVNGALSATKVERGGREAEAGDDRGDRGAEAGDDRGHDGAGHDAGDDRGHDGPGHDAGDDRGHGGHDG